MESGIKAMGVPMGALADQIASIASPEFKAELARRLGATVLKLVDDGFAKSVDPYGKPWKPITYRDGLPLVDTARLRNSYSDLGVTVKPQGFQVGTNVVYAGMHQYGAEIGAHVRRVTPRTILLVQSKDTPTGYKFASTKDRRNLNRRTTGAATVAFTKVHDSGWAAGYSLMKFKGHTFTRRQMVPEDDTGGIGEIWGKDLNAEADATIREWVGQEPDTGGA